MKTHMEPNDFDKLIKDKLNRPTDIYKTESDKAKPFVWNAISSNAVSAGSIKWYHLVAAVILPLILFSFVLIQIQNHHQKEIEFLSEQIQNMEANYSIQSTSLNEKNVRILNMEKEFEKLSSNRVLNTTEKSAVSKERLIYITDTVYIQRTAHVVTDKNPVEHLDKKESNVPEDIYEPDQPDIKNQEANIDNDIFLTYSDKSKNPDEKSTKVKFGPFAKKE